MCLIDVWNCLLCEIEFLCELHSSACEEQIGILVISSRRAALAWAKISKSRICHYARSRLGELGSLEREILSSKQTNLAWARICSDFLVAHCKWSRPGESSSPMRGFVKTWGCARGTRSGEEPMFWATEYLAQARGTRLSEKSGLMHVCSDVSPPRWVMLCWVKGDLV